MKLRAWCAVVQLDAGGNLPPSRGNSAASTDSNHSLRMYQVRTADHPPTTPPTFLPQTAQIFDGFALCFPAKPHTPLPLGWKNRANPSQICAVCVSELPPTPPSPKYGARSFSRAARARRPCSSTRAARVGALAQARENDHATAVKLALTAMLFVIVHCSLLLRHQSEPVTKLYVSFCFFWSCHASCYLLTCPDYVPCYVPVTCPVTRPVTRPVKDCAIMYALLHAATPCSRWARRSCHQSGVVRLRVLASNSPRLPYWVPTCGTGTVRATRRGGENRGGRHSCFIERRLAGTPRRSTQRCCCKTGVWRRGRARGAPPRASPRWCEQEKGTQRQSQRERRWARGKF